MVKRVFSFVEHEDGTTTVNGEPTSISPMQIYQSLIAPPEETPKNLDHARQAKQQPKREPRRKPRDFRDL